MEIIFYYPKTLLGRLIKLFSPIILNREVKYSHVGIVLDRFHTLDINGGNNSKIRHISANENDFDIIKVNLSYDQQTEFCKTIARYLDLKYDYLKALNLNNKKEKYTCYELVNLILYDIGYLDEIYDIKLPEDLIDILKRKEV